MTERNISIAKINGYTLEKVLLAKKYLEEIGSSMRTFPYDKLVTYYNEVKGTNESTSGCKCQAAKYYNGIKDYFHFGRLTLINNGLATEEDFNKPVVEKQEPIENVENRVVLTKEEQAEISGLTTEELEVEVKAIEQELPKPKKNKK